MNKKMNRDSLSEFIVKQEQTLVAMPHTSKNGRNTLNIWSHQY